MKKIATDLFGRIVEDNGWWKAVPMLFRKSERSVWGPRCRTMFHRFGPRAAEEWKARAARLIVEPNETALTDVIERASHRRSWWHLSYNLACYYAMQTNPPAALMWLETALQRPGSGQMGGGWLNEDPDLESIRDEPRFRAVAEQLAPAKAIVVVEGTKTADG